jgi:ribosomal protein S18 acetylase RimI-like enzyme
MDILTDFTPSSLARAIEANMIASWSDLGRSQRVELHESENLVWFSTGEPFLPLNRILRARFDAGDRQAQDLRAQIEGALAPFRARGVPVTWHTGPTTRPPDLGAHLVAYGLTHKSTEPGMALDLAELEEENPPPGLEIRPVVDPADLRGWSRVFTLAFGSQEDQIESAIKVETDLGVGQHAWRRLYVGLWEGEIVASALLFLAAGVAGLYGVGTMPEVRRRGIGRAMTVAALEEARRLGYRVATLHASPLGVDIYRRLGFRTYCQLGRYVWTGEA